MKGKSKGNHRQTTKKNVDNRIFKHTAMKTKKINVSPKTSRGGIML